MSFEEMQNGWQPPPQPPTLNPLTLVLNASSLSLGYSSLLSPCPLLPDPWGHPSQHGLLPVVVTASLLGGGGVVGMTMGWPAPSTRVPWLRSIAITCLTIRISRHPC